MLFFRKNSRLGVSWSWPEMKPGEWVFEAHAPVAFGELQQPLLLEVIPSATVSAQRRRVRARPWQDARRKGDLGASVKYGITSTTTLDATVNPDFSQVESDAFEVEVNQRFPIFFSEKRPFFMEGLGLFNLAGTGGDSTMRTAVHTRRIVDPERRRQADRHGGPLHVRDAPGAGRVGRRPTASKMFTHRPRAAQLRRRTVRRRAGDRHGVPARLQPRHRRRHLR